MGDNRYFIISIVLFSVLFVAIIGLGIYLHYSFQEINEKLDTIDGKVDRNYEAEQNVSLRTLKLLENMRDYNKVINENIFSAFSDIKDSIEINDEKVEDIVDDLKKLKEGFRSILLEY